MAEAISAGDIATLFNLDQRLKEQEQMKQDQAIRFQGAQEYNSLLQEGLPHEEAIRRTAHKMFYNDPGAMTSALRLAPTPEPAQPKLMNVGGRLVQISPGGKASELYVPPEDTEAKYRVLPQGLVQLDKTGPRWANIAGTPPATTEKSVTLNEQLQVERLLGDKLKDLADLSPETEEYTQALDQIKRLEAKLGIKRNAPAPPGGAEAGAPAPADGAPSFLRSPRNPLFMFGRGIGKMLSSPKSASPGAPAVPKAGEVRKGYRFKGGNPADQKNWEKVE